MKGGKTPKTATHTRKDIIQYKERSEKPKRKKQIKTPRNQSIGKCSNKKSYKN